MSSIPQELELLYKRYFGKNPFVIVPELTSFINDAKVNVQKTVYSSKNGILQKQYLGVEIWLPITLYNLPAEIGNNGSLFLPYCTLRIGSNVDIVKSNCRKRRGTVKEFYGIDDYTISIKGFFIDKEYRSFPEQDVINLKKLHEYGKPFQIENVITNIFLEGNKELKDMGEINRVVITKFEMPEVEGGKKSMRPFTMELLSDDILIIELND